MMQRQWVGDLIHSLLFTLRQCVCARMHLHAFSTLIVFQSFP